MLAGSLLVDLLVTPAEYMAILYAIPMVVAAWLLPPRATAVVAVAGVAVSVLGAVWHPQPSAANWVDTATVVLIAFVSYLLSARIKDAQDRMASERNLITAMLQVEQEILALARGEAHEPLRMEGPKEGKELAEAFSHMAQEIRQREDRLLRVHEELDLVSNRVLEQAQETERTNERLSAIQSVTGLQLSVLAPDAMLSALLLRLSEVLHCDATAVLLLQGGDQELAVRSATGLRRNGPGGYRVPVAEDVVSQIVVNGLPLVVDDLSKVQAGTTLLHGDAGSLVGAPLQIGAQVIGVVYAESRAPRHFTEDDVLLLQLVADRAALALTVERLGAKDGI